MTLYGEIVVLNKKSIVFTDYQVRIAQLIADDYRVKEVAKMVGLSFQSIQKHLLIMKKKLGLQSTPALVALLYQEKIIK